MKADDDFEGPAVHPLLNPSEAEKFMEMLESGQSLDSMEDALGEKLTEGNVDKFQAFLKEAGKKIGTTEDAANQLDPSKLSPHEKKEHARLSEAVEAGAFDTKSYLGNQFRDFLKQNKDQMDKFKSLSGRAEQAEFRAEWARKQLSKFVEQRTYSRSWTRIDRTRGNYRNFARLVVDFGGWQSKEAIQGATTAANKCLAMGWPWIMVHPQSELLTFLVLDYGYEEQFSKAWTHFRKESHAGALSDKAADIDNGKPELQIEGTGKDKGKDNKADDKVQGDKDKDDGKGKGGKDKGGKDKGAKVNKAQKPEDMDSATLWREGSKIKLALQAASCSAVEIIEKVGLDEAWSWAKGVQINKLTTAQTALKSNMSDWHKKFVMTASANSMKKEFSTAMCETELVKFIKLKSLVDKLQAVNSAIYKAHDEIMKG
jgi:hypothetical protein